VSETNSDGVFADVAISVAGPLALVGAVDWARNTSQLFGFDQSLEWLAASGGMRVNLGSRRVVPFGQILFGVERDALAIERFADDASSHALVQPGVGVAADLVGRVGLLGQIDWRRVSRDEDKTGVRIAVGARVRLH
jgi:hypothetical protein